MVNLFKLGIIIFFSVSFAYNNVFSFIKNYDGEKINLRHEPIISEINEYSRLVKEGTGHTTELGFPELPIFSTFYMLDPSKIYEYNFEVIDSYTIENIKILPHQGLQEWQVDDVEIINEDFYFSNQSYPSDNMIISDRIQGRGIEFINIQIIPYKYYSESNKLIVYTDVDIKINEVGLNSNYDLVQTQRSHIFDTFYKDLIINFEFSNYQSDYQSSSILYIVGGNWIENEYVQDLFDWRHKQGYIVSYVTTSEIGASNGNENIIKNYIVDAYQNWEHPPEIVGLIGDTDVIDCFYQPWGTGGWNSYNGSTDSDYSYLVGNDLIPEVFVGRISAQGVSTMENVINKTIKYEKAEYLDDDFFMSAALVGDPSQSGNSTIFTSQYIENIMINHGMTNTEGFFYENGISNWLVDKFNDGISYYNYRGIYGDDGTDFSQLSNQINNGYKTPFATVMTCGTGDFDEGNSQTEEFVKYGSVNNPKGAVAAIGLATTGTHTAYNNILNMGIYDAIFVKKMWYAGAAEAGGDLAMIQTYPSNPGNATEAFTGWTNLIGDPALHLWTDIPKNFAVDYIDTIPLGTNSLELTVYNEYGDIVENARVTLLMGDDIIFETGLTDESGKIVLNWDMVELGTIDITVIKRNHRPYEGAIEIVPTDFSVGVDIDGPVEIESGQTHKIPIKFKNFSNFKVHNAKAEFSSSSEFILLNDNEIYFDIIAPNEEVVRFISLYIYANTFNFEEIDLRILLSDNIGNEIVSYIPINVLGPYINIADYNGTFTHDAVSDIILNIENIGDNSIDNFSINILSSDSMIEVESSIMNFDKLAQNENLYLDGFNVNFNSNIINGSLVPLDLYITMSDGSVRKISFNITAGEQRLEDPVGPDAYGYYIYDNNDTDYDIAPEYNWIEIAEDLGDQLALVDYGNGNYSGSYTYSSEIIELPFVFTFYGVDYNKIIVNTNGWISFGDYKMYSFRNYPIPGAGGPSPMIAAFWDDLKTGSGGYVHYYESNEKVIIQWDDMRTYDNNGAYRETFQLILYNKELFSPTVTGDSEIKIQYQEFNNTSDGYYPNGGTPTHGCYSTIGIENHLGDIGLQYTFNNIYPAAASRLEDGSAIFITTGRLPKVDLSIDNVSFQDKTLDIMINSEEEIAGFQFELFGINLTEISGGIAEENDFVLSASSTAVLGFSITGTTIPASSGVLAQISFSDYSGNGICFGTDPINNVVSNIYGYELETNWGDCFESTLLGDINLDGNLDILDLVGLSVLILNNEYISSGDINQDQILDILDIVNLINLILN